MFGDEDQWQKAYAEFFVAFTTYQVHHLPRAENEI